MRFYTKRHKFYCGIDLHAKKMYLCILDQAGEIRLHQNIKTDRQRFLETINPFRDDIVIAVECMFTWSANHFTDREVTELRYHSPGFWEIRQLVGRFERYFRIL